MQVQLKKHKKVMDTIKSHLKPPSEGKAKAKAKGKPKKGAA